jgi:hypothetical protein
LIAKSSVPPVSVMPPLRVEMNSLPCETKATSAFFWSQTTWLN